MSSGDFPFPRRAGSFPFGLVVGVFGAFVIGFGSLLGYYFHARQALGVPMIAALQHTSPDAVTRIILRPSFGESRRSPDELDPDSLVKTPVEVTDPDAIHAVMKAIARAETSSSPNRRDWVRWRCNLVINSREGSWQCKTTATDRGALLEFWSNGLSGWALGTLRSESLNELLSQVVKQQESPVGSQ